MTDAVAHRGPDDCGQWVADHVAFGHRRLSIIDLSDAGRQPMRDDTGRYTLVFNGELYNFEELRRDLEAKGCRFRSRTDSEVLLNAYRAWGPDALDRFNGMWAFAIWDAQREELFAARDRAGKKPFYYVRDRDGDFYFASEIKAFLAIGMRFQIDAQAAFDFLTQGTYGHLGARGFFAGVQQLPAAHWMVVRPGAEPRWQRYWELPVVREADRLPYDNAFRSRFRELLDDAVRLRLRADVPVGATLSGGLDSSAIVTLADRITDGAPIHLFTSLYPGSRHDETPYFEAVVRRLRSPIIHRLTPSASSFRSDLVRVLDHQEEPFGDTSILAHFRLMQGAREAGVPVVLSGQGGDELLFGYPSMVHAYVGHLLGRAQLRQAFLETRAWASGSGIAYRAIIPSALAHALPLPFRDRVRALYVSRVSAVVTSSLRERAVLSRFAIDRRRSSLDDYIAQVFTRFAIPHLVHYDDRNAMTFGVEGRMPFLDHRIIDLVFGVRYEALVQDGVTKRVLRESLADLLPASVCHRRDKVGFHTPLGPWLRTQMPWVEEVLDDDRVRALGAVDAPAVRARLGALWAGDDSAALAVWRPFILHLWAQHFCVTLDGAGDRPALAA